MKKTNAMRILEGMKIPFETSSYEDDGKELSRGAAEALAEKLGISPACVYKTIVMRTDSKQIVVFCQSALYEINLKKARQACGAKEVNPVKPEELQKLTGYIRGGCSPLGMTHKYPTFIDETVNLHEKVYVSAGTRGMQIILAPADLIKATEAVVTDLILEQ